jgi:hypothetical protein
MLLATACGEGGGDNATPTPTPTASLTPKNIFDLEAGDCIVIPSLLAGETADVEQVPTVDCSELHDAEVVGVIQLAGGLYPSQSYIAEQVARRCPAGTSFFFYPTITSWTFGDRDVACVLESVSDLEVGVLTDPRLDLR